MALILGLAAGLSVLMVEAGVALLVYALVFMREEE